MQTNVHSVLCVIGLSIMVIAGLAFSCVQAEPIMHPSLAILCEPVSVSDALFGGGCLEKVALRNSLCQLISVRVDTFLCDSTVQSHLSIQQRDTIDRLKRKLGGVSHSNRSIKTSLAWMAAFDGFDDVSHLYSLLGSIDDGTYDNKFSSAAMFPGFPFDDLIAKVPLVSVKAALSDYKNGNTDGLLYVINTGSPEEKRVAIACCATMLIAISGIIAGHVRGLTSCINLIQIYEQVEQLPIENVLQAMHCLIQRMGIMLANLSREEGGFVGWLKHKWVYLPVAVVVIILRIAKYYWGGQSMFGTCFSNSNNWGNQYNQVGGTAQFGTHYPIFEPRIIYKKRDSNFKKNAEVVVGSA